MKNVTMVCNKKRHSGSYYYVIVYDLIYLKYFWSNLYIPQRWKKKLRVEDCFPFHMIIIPNTKIYFPPKNRISASCPNLIIFIAYNINIILMDIVYMFVPMLDNHFAPCFVKIGWEMLKLKLLLVLLLFLMRVFKGNIMVLYNIYKNLRVLITYLKFSFKKYKIK